MPRIIALFFLVLMTQALTYPSVIFSLYSTSMVQGDARSLPVDFPDNGQSCFFGTGSSEEENESQRHFTFEHVFFSHFSSALFPRYSTEVFVVRKLEPNVFQSEKVLSPPPEPVFCKA